MKRLISIRTDRITAAPSSSGQGWRPLDAFWHKKAVGGSSNLPGATFPPFLNLLYESVKKTWPKRNASRDELLPMDTKIRCGWADPRNLKYIAYHDDEWGRPEHDDRILFEFLILEGAQAGLSWSTILNKRENYRKALDGFDPKKVASYDERTVQKLLLDKGIVRNRLKIKSAIQNAKAFLAIQKEFGSFDKYLWGFVKGKPIKNSPRTLKDIPPRIELSDAISLDLKKRGMNFVGSTIIYAYLQAVGVVDDHLIGCFRH